MNTPLPSIDGYEAIAGPPPSLGELTGLIRAQQVHFGARTTASEGSISILLTDHEIEHIHIRMLSSGLLVAASTYQNPEPYIQSYTRVWVHPDHMDRGIGSALTDWSVAKARNDLSRAPVGTRITNACSAREAKATAGHVLEHYGYHIARCFLEMTIDLDHGVESATFPDDVSVRTIRDEDGIDLVADAQHEAFRDHFGWVDRPAAARYAEWNNWRASDLWKNDLVWLVEADTGVVAVLTAIDAYGSSETTGYIAVLGVLKEWRGKGIAQALLATAFAAFQRRGKESVVLHVDADSLTGATRLYERMGMRITEESASYEIEIRPGKDVVVR
ncbi:MAG: hypothetical protein BMS9Abin12_0147 [Acidimicrobiia bacterium]|nr:MAG: hypothetical protein BMS9Abin12_0147 [Acidimicrobiia bacterium]